MISYRGVWTPIIAGLGPFFKTCNQFNEYGVELHLLKDYDPAIKCFEESLNIRQKLQEKRSVASTLYNLAKVYRELGNLSEACALHKKSLAIWIDIADKEGIAWALEAFAALAVKEREPDRAAKLFGAAEVLRKEIDARLPKSHREEYDRYFNAARNSSTTEEIFAATLAEGRLMTIDQAVDYALSESMPP